MVLLYECVNMEKSKFWKRVGDTISKFIATLLICCICTISISAESEVYMITNDSVNTLKYSKTSIDVSLVTECSLPYSHIFACVKILF